jgi:iduronate 2-sulfatase
LYPSLCEMTGLALPQHLQGRSFATLMQNPEADWKSAAVGRFTNGDTIRTESFRFTEYTNAKGQVTSRMLYNHITDPAENVNVLQAREEVVSDLAEELHRLGVFGL